MAGSTQPILDTLSSSEEGEETAGDATRATDITQRERTLIALLVAFGSNGYTDSRNSESNRSSNTPNAFPLFVGRNIVGRSVGATESSGARAAATATAATAAAAAAAANIRIDNRHISCRHAAIDCTIATTSSTSGDDNRILVAKLTDLGSTAGTFLDKRSKSTRLEPGRDTILTPSDRVFILANEKCRIQVLDAEMARQQQQQQWYGDVRTAGNISGTPPLKDLKSEDEEPSLAAAEEASTEAETDPEETEIATVPPPQGYGFGIERDIYAPPTAQSSSLSQPSTTAATSTSAAVTVTGTTVTSTTAVAKKEKSELPGSCKGSAGSNAALTTIITTTATVFADRQEKEGRGVDTKGQQQQGPETVSPPNVFAALSSANAKGRDTPGLPGDDHFDHDHHGGFASDVSDELISQDILEEVEAAEEAYVVQSQQQQQQQTQHAISSSYENQQQQRAAVTMAMGDKNIVVEDGTSNAVEGASALSTAEDNHLLSAGAVATAVLSLANASVRTPQEPLVPVIAAAGVKSPGTDTVSFAVGPVDAIGTATAATSTAPISAEMAGVLDTACTNTGGQRLEGAVAGVSDGGEEEETGEDVEMTMPTMLISDGDVVLTQQEQDIHNYAGVDHSMVIEPTQLMSDGAESSPQEQSSGVAAVVRVDTADNTSNINVLGTLPTTAPTQLISDGDTVALISGQAEVLGSPGEDDLVTQAIEGRGDAGCGSRRDVDLRDQGFLQPSEAAHGATQALGPIAATLTVEEADEIEATQALGAAPASSLSVCSSNTTGGPQSESAVALESHVPHVQSSSVADTTANLQAADGTATEAAEKANASRRATGAAIQDVQQVAPHSPRLAQEAQAPEPEPEQVGNSEHKSSATVQHSRFSPSICDEVQETPMFNIDFEAQTSAAALAEQTARNGEEEEEGAIEDTLTSTADAATTDKNTPLLTTWSPLQLPPPMSRAGSSEGSSSMVLSSQLHERGFEPAHMPPGSPPLFDSITKEASHASLSATARTVPHVLSTDASAAGVEAEAEVEAEVELEATRPEIQVEDQAHVKAKADMKADAKAARSSTNDGVIIPDKIMGRDQVRSQQENESPGSKSESERQPGLNFKSRPALMPMPKPKPKPKLTPEQEREQEPTSPSKKSVRSIRLASVRKRKATHKPSTPDSSIPTPAPAPEPKRSRRGRSRDAAVRESKAIETGSSSVPQLLPATAQQRTSCARNKINIAAKPRHEQTRTRRDKAAAAELETEIKPVLTLESEHEANKADQRQPQTEAETEAKTDAKTEPEPTRRQGRSRCTKRSAASPLPVLRDASRPKRGVTATATTAAAAATTDNARDTNRDAVTDTVIGGAEAAKMVKPELDVDLSKSESTSSSLSPPPPPSSPPSSIRRVRRAVASVGASSNMRILITRNDDPNVEATIRGLGGTIVKTAFDCTHVYASGIARTIKFLTAVAQGRGAVGKEWLAKSVSLGRLASAERYPLKDADSEARHGFNLGVALARARQKRLLAGRSVHALKNSKPPPLELRKLVEASGGTWLSRLPRANDPAVIVICPSKDVAKVRKLTHCDNVHSPEYLLGGILRQQLDPE
eukprot:UC1_evm2s1859